MEVLVNSGSSLDDDLAALDARSELTQRIESRPGLPFLDEAVLPAVGPA